MSYDIYYHYKNRKKTNITVALVINVTWNFSDNNESSAQ